jgi:hypothetical protein
VKIRDTSEDLTSWSNFIPSPKKSFKEENTKKYVEKDKNALEKGVVCPGHAAM